MDPIQYNLLRTGNWTIDKLRKQVIQLLDPKGTGSVLPTHHVGSLMTACLSEFIRRFPHKASGVDMPQPDQAKPAIPQVKPAIPQVKPVTKGKAKKAKKKGTARLGF